MFKALHKHYEKETYITDMYKTEECMLLARIFQMTAHAKNCDVIQWRI